MSFTAITIGAIGGTLPTASRCAVWDSPNLGSSRASAPSTGNKPPPNWILERRKPGFTSVETPPCTRGAKLAHENVCCGASACCRPRLPDRSQRGDLIGMKFYQDAKVNHFRFHRAPTLLGSSVMGRPPWRLSRTSILVNGLLASDLRIVRRRALRYIAPNNK